MLVERVARYNTKEIQNTEELRLEHKTHLRTSQQKIMGVLKKSMRIINNQADAF